jgi:hypothetical protein
LPTPSATAVALLSGVSVPPAAVTLDCLPRATAGAVLAYLAPPLVTSALSNGTAVERAEILSALACASALAALCPLEVVQQCRAALLEDRLGMRLCMDLLQRLLAQEVRVALVRFWPRNVSQDAYSPWFGRWRMFCADTTRGG